MVRRSSSRQKLLPMPGSPLNYLPTVGSVVTDATHLIDGCVLHQV